MRLKVLPLVLCLAMLVSMVGVIAPASPVAAAANWYVNGLLGTDNSTQGTSENAGAFRTIQYAVNDSRVVSGDTVYVAPWDNYTGAYVRNKFVAIVGIGSTDNRPVITSGYNYGRGNTGTGTPTAGFRLDDTADGSEIRNFTIDCNQGSGFYFGVFSRQADSVVVDSLEINGPVQGITNWAGSNWAVTNNSVLDVGAVGGGGIGILLGVRPATPYCFPTCGNNSVRGNTITPSASVEGFTCPGICLWLDLRAAGASPAGTDLSGNQITGNSYWGEDLTNQVGIEVGVAFDPPNPATPASIAAAQPHIHDNTVSGNTVDSADIGVYVYSVTNLAVRDNELRDCRSYGIYLEEGGISGGGFSCNEVYNAAVGLLNYSSAAGIDATNNWWGCAAGPGNAGCGSASDNVDYDPWLEAPLGSDASVSTITGTGTAVLSPDAGGVRGLTAVGLPDGAPDLIFGHGLFSFTNCCVVPNSSATITISLPSAVPAGAQYWKYGPTPSNESDHWYQIPMGSNDGDNVITITLKDGGDGDDDLEANGEIVDQGGPGWPFPAAEIAGEPVEAFPGLWIGIGAALALGVVAFLVRRRLTASAC